MYRYVDYNVRKVTRTLNDLQSIMALKDELNFMFCKDLTVSSCSSVTNTHLAKVWLRRCVDMMDLLHLTLKKLDVC